VLTAALLPASARVLSAELPQQIAAVQGRVREYVLDCL
jgi:hypothetical protein